VFKSVIRVPTYQTKTLFNDEKNTALDKNPVFMRFITLAKMLCNERKRPS
jgi:hypothetical protein